jgi:hypothetical protein
MSSTLLLAMLRDCVSNAVRAAQLLRQCKYIRLQKSDDFDMAKLRSRMSKDGTYHVHRRELAKALFPAHNETGTFPFPRVICAEVL